MKLFQQLLVAPAALGLMTPLAATAAELNINGVSDYSASSQEVKSISSFSDVYPTDWAYKALSNLRERHGCAAANPTGSMTRYEAAALLNKCLETVAQVNSEEQALIDEFSAELAVIKGRVDSLEAEMGQYEAGLFSTTTKLSGTTTYIVGAVDSPENTAEDDAVHFLYDTKISLDTSFNGDDLFKTRIRTGSFSTASSTSPFESGGLAALEVANTGTANALEVDRSYYQFPVGDDFTATIGAKVRQDDMLAVWPSSYPSDSVLDVLTYAGANAAYALTEGAGAGVSYNSGNIAASLLFVSDNATDAANGGILTGSGSDDVSAQLAYIGDSWTVAAVWTSADGGDGTSTPNKDAYEAWGLSADWQVGADSAFIPSSVSVGYGQKSPDNTDDTDCTATTCNIEDETTWSVGLQWEDAFVDGNTLGIGIGTQEGHRDDSGYDDPLVYEIFYSMAVTDNITVTPSVFIIEQDKACDADAASATASDCGGLTGSADSDKYDDVVGAMIKTTFRF